MALDTADLTPGQTLRAAALGGAIAWAVYAVAECLFTSVVPWVVRSGVRYEPVHGGLTTALVLFYPLLGAIVGAGLGSLLWIARKRFGSLDPASPALGSLSVGAAFTLNLFHLVLVSPDSFLPWLHPFASVDDLVGPLIISFILVAACLASVVWPRSAARLRLFTSPWTTGLLLTGLPWVALHLAQRPEAVKAGGLLVYALALFGIVAGGQRLASSVRPRWLAPAIALVVIWAVSIAVDQGPPVREDPPPVRGGPRTPNVILMVLDTVRADRMSLYGYERRTTPVLEELATGATLYRTAISSGNFTLTTHGSLFTGLYARQHGARVSRQAPSGRTLGEGFVTLAEILREAGYWTMAVVANQGYVSPQLGFAQGFHHFDNRGPVSFLSVVSPYYLRRGVRAALVPHAPRAMFDRTSRDARTINDEVFSLLDRAQERAGPFFLFVNYMEAHQPYIPPEPFDTRFPGKLSGFTSHDYARLLSKTKRGKGLTEEERAHLDSMYDGEISFLDSEIGRLLRRLSELGLEENTLLIITSDHGEALGERSLLGHGKSVYQDQVGVPLVIRYPGQETGDVVTERASSVDVMPTILDVLGLPGSDGLAGRSLRHPEALGGRTVVTESFGVEARGIYRDSYKLIRWAEGTSALFDLAADPDEERDLLEAGAPDVARALDAELDRWLET